MDLCTLVDISYGYPVDSYGLGPGVAVRKTLVNRRRRVQFSFDSFDRRLINKLPYWFIKKATLQLAHLAGWARIGGLGKKWNGSLNLF